MPIEFQCTSCNQVVITPDETAGKKGRCPHCNEIQRIPSTSGQADSPAGAEPPTIEFQCNSCNELVTIPAEFAGKKGKCPYCQSVIQIPLSSTAKKTSAPKPAAAASRPQAPRTPPPQAEQQLGSIEFSCSSCGELVVTPASAAGKKGKCPHCREVVLIPKKSASNKREQPAPAPQPAAGRAAPQTAQASAEDKIRFPCTRCGKTVTTPASAGGKKGKCPHCSAVVTIPTAAAKAGPKPKPQPKPQPKPKPRPAPRQAAGVDGLTPLDDAAGGLVPIDDVADGLVPIDDAGGGLTPLTDDGGGLVPLDDLTPLDAGVTPLGPTGGQAGWGGAPATPMPQVNPYQTPAGGFQTKQAPKDRVSFGQAFQSTFSILLSNAAVSMIVSVLAVVIYVVFAVALGLLVWGELMAIGALVSRMKMDQFTAIWVGFFIALFLFLEIFFSVVAFVSWLHTNLSYLFVNMVKNNESDLKDMFGANQYFPRVFGLMLLWMLMQLVGGGAGVAALYYGYIGVGTFQGLMYANQIITYLIALLLYLSTFLIVDQETGVLDSIQESGKKMFPNIPIVFLIHLVVAIPWIVFFVFMRFVAKVSTVWQPGGFSDNMPMTIVTAVIFVVLFFFFLPFFYVLNAVIYCQATGIETGDMKQKPRTGAWGGFGS